MYFLATLEDRVVPFLLAQGEVRGRLVRLGQVADTILTRYPYPPAVANLLGELLAVAALLGGGLKQEGIVTIQIRGNGLLPLVVVDAVHGGALRGYAEVPSQVKEWIRAKRLSTPQELLGEQAFLTITFDPGEGMQRYQGIVALEGSSIAESLKHYFERSQQIDARVVLAVSHGHPKFVGGLMIERMPEAQGGARNEESWAYAQAMAATLTPDELLDPALNGEELLYRLFHEEGVRAFAPQALSVGCRCSRERIEAMLSSMSLDDRMDMLVDGKVNVHCQFCNRSEFFTSAEIGLRKH